MPAIKREVVSKKAKKPDEMYLPVIYYHYDIHKGFGKKEPVTIPIFDKHAFLTPQEVIAYLPFFITELVKKGDLPKNVIRKDENGKEFIDDNIVKTGYEVLHLSTLDLSENEDD